MHGHFYQPPRENPWTGEVDPQPSAAPFHDWNDRISKECYEANAQAPILNSKGQVIFKVNNYSKMSFDFGPTLLSWVRRKKPRTYQQILEADRQSLEDRGGHGNAIAQVYNHIIMPLAKKRDKITQVVWGIRDFEFHFKRKPEGMWLAEAAVDRETLRILADHGILYTILSPGQAYRTRRCGFGQRWQHLKGQSIDPKRAYRILLDWGRQFHIFFYDQWVSLAIAFDGLLNSGDALNSRLLGAFARYGSGPQLMSTSTDGETFGHHHKFGEMAIAYAMKRMEDQRWATLTNFGEYLDRFGSQWEVDIYENSSWSCCHGVERWRADCGCRINQAPGWNQRWRTVLREAFDYVQTMVDEVYEVENAPYLKDPWQARNDYIDVMTDPSDESRRRFLERNQKRELSPEEARKVWDLLEAEKFSLFMYTSCGWFFDDISGIEPVHNLKFAARAIEFVQPYLSHDVEATFVQILHHAKSNLPERGTGANIYADYVQSARPRSPKK